MSGSADALAGSVPGALGVDRRGGRRPGAGRPAGEVRSRLRQVVAEGLCGSADFLAERTGWPPPLVRAALKELVRAGEAQNLAPLAQGFKGRPAGVFAGPARRDAVDALAFAARVWR
jgi:predicted ArsR family transcriptional regulator